MNDIYTKLIFYIRQKSFVSLGFRFCLLKFLLKFTPRDSFLCLFIRHQYLLVTITFSHHNHLTISYSLVLLNPSTPMKMLRKIFVKVIKLGSRREIRQTGLPPLPKIWYLKFSCEPSFYPAFYFSFVIIILYFLNSVLFPFLIYFDKLSFFASCKHDIFMLQVVNSAFTEVNELKNICITVFGFLF